VAVVDQNVARKGTGKVAQAYLNYLYSDEGQDIVGKNFYRPIAAKAQAKYAKLLPPLPLFSIDQAFGGWAKADKDHFADGASFDQIYLQR
jgi:sulfate transport system substrate-binding protein